MDDLSKRNSRTCCYGKDVISKSCQHKLPSPELIPAIANSQFRPLQRKSSSQPKVFLELAEEGLAVLLLAAWPTGSGYFTCHSRSYTWFCLLHWDWMWHQSSKHSLLSAELYSANQTSKTTDRANTPNSVVNTSQRKAAWFSEALHVSESAKRNGNAESLPSSPPCLPPFSFRLKVRLLDLSQSSSQALQH